MNLDDIKDQLRDQFNALWSRIQESTTFNSVKEQYEAWPVVAQKAVVFGSGAILVLIVLSIPLSYISSASTAIEEYDEYRLLLRDLQRVGRTAKDPLPLPPGLSATDLQSQTQAIMTEFALLPEQNAGAMPLQERPAGNMAPPMFHQAGVALTLKKLNLNQVLDIGYRLQNINFGTKLTGIEINANREDNHYYDVVYKIVSFSLPMSGAPVPGSDGGGD